MKSTATPLISVITPFLNVESFFAETIESVLQQEYTNWELLLIDDGSTDGSTEIALNYVQKYPEKIAYYAHELHANKGASASRNLGVKHARGNMLAFLDSDDIWLPKKLKSQLKILEQYPQVTVLCEATKFWYSWFNPNLQDVVLQLGAPQDQLYYPPQLAKQLYPLGKGYTFCTCALIMKKDVFDKFGGFDETFTEVNQLYEDQVLFTKIYLHEVVYISSECNNWYRQRPNSLMHGLKSNGHYKEGRYFFLLWMKQYLLQKNIADPEIQFLLKKAFWPYKWPVLSEILEFRKNWKQRVKSLLKR